MTLSDEFMEQLAKDALRRPRDFGTSDESAFTTHGCLITMHRDSDILDQSNYIVANKILTAVPDSENEDGWKDVYTMHAGHWAVGWMDHLMVRVRDDNGEFTEAWRTLCGLVEGLMDYPVLDDEDFSMREAEAREPRCDVCNAYCEDVEWDGNCGNCVEHCAQYDGCPERVHASA